MRGTQIKQADEVRVFAHDAATVAPNDSVDISSIAGGSDIRVTMESGSEVTFKGVTAGSFLPILVTRVWSTGTTASEILALY